MKLAILSLIALFSFSAFADCNREAQFIGTVKNLKHIAATESTVEHFSYQIKLGFNGNYWFAASMVCPLWEDELESATIEVAGAPYLTEGNQVSGVLVFDQKIQDYKVE